MPEETSKPLIVADAKNGIKVNSGVVAKQFRDEIKSKVAAMQDQGLGTCQPTHVVLLHSSKSVWLIYCCYYFFRTTAFGRFACQQRPCGKTICGVDWSRLQKRWSPIRVTNGGRSNWCRECFDWCQWRSQSSWYHRVLSHFWTRRIL